ncbi:S26 family signal peptidase [Caulobacter sp. UNC358MFTsu5.1]|uniref:S26 family signal peptidase n=1 Tax=Caulobacter sp. UNC358MFTsu5.1 TaxID=1449049 RepID=UPI0004A6FB51|nr:S26 family signal peptidase [Caulobacter sp. UNC358MFTsu5.1]
MRRVLALVASGTACLLLARPPSPPRWMWNATASVPVGLYALTPPTGLRRGDLVAIDPPGPLAARLADQGLLPPGVPLLKPVAAQAGQVVCRWGGVVSIDGATVAIARARDGLGRSLPGWSGCRRLDDDDLFVLSPAPGSYDGRYFGVLPTSAVIARARPVWIPKPSRSRP